MVDEDVRQHHAADLEPRTFERVRFTEELHNVGSKSTNGAFLDRDQQFMLPRELKYEFVVDWLGKARVGDGR